MINNANTEWDGNGSAKGIQIGSMSFEPFITNPGDQGDNGSGAEARLINNATENGIVCVVAMGNDGTQESFSLAQMGRFLLVQQMIEVR